MIPHDGRHDRRSFLKVAGSAGAAGMAGLAGCTGGGGDGGDGGDGGGGGDGGDGGGGDTPMQTTAKSEMDPIVIGQYGALSGPVSSVGVGTVRGGRMAIEEINEAGGIDGRQIEAPEADSEASPETMIKRARALVQQDDVDFIVGGSSSAVAKALLQFVATQTDDVIYIATGPQTPDITGPECQRQGFRVASNIIHFNVAAAEMIARATPDDAVRVAGVNPDYVYGHQSWEVFQDAMKERRDVEIVSETFPAFLKGDYKKEIQQTLDAEPDILHSVLFSGDMVSFIKQASQFELFDKIPNFYAGQTPTIVAEALGDQFPEGAFANADAYLKWPESRGGTPQRVTDFVTGHRDRFGSLPSATGYDQHSAMYGIKKAIEKAGSTATDDVINALEGLSWESVAPNENIREGDHQTIRDFYPSGVMGPLDEYDVMGFTEQFDIGSDVWADEDTCEKF